MTAPAMATEAPTRPRLLGGPAGSASGGADLASHHRRHGPLPAAGGPTGPTRLIEAVRAAGLTGRGGAAFPTWRKLASVAASAARTGREPVVVANAAEGEPASRKDRTLLLHAPHLVLDGLRLAADAVGARRAYLYLPPRYADGMRAALAQRQGSGWDRLPVELVGAPHGFVAGEESAVLASIEGRPAVPVDRLRPVAESGLRGAPSLVQNVETLAHLALVARHGPDWFRGAGTAEEPGTFLATVGGAVHRPGVYEAGRGVPLGDLLAMAGGPAAPVQAVLVGGYHGAWLPGTRLDAQVSLAGLAPFGGAPGAGVVIVLPEGACGLRAAADIVSYLAEASAGQCGPCRNGLPAIAAEFATLASAAGPALTGRPGDGAGGRPGDGAGGRPDPARIEWLARLVTGRGACRHPDGTARLVASALRTFDPEVGRHAGGTCVEGSTA
jgi:NADH:ubiquinone oxidoreductase subunit F (NADH-binding)